MLETRNAQSRRGVTLMEVLIAMMVLTLGMMGMLALFPLGAAQMAQAVKDERTSQLADTCEGQMRIIWRSAWLDANGLLVPDLTAFQSEPAFQALDVPSASTSYDSTLPSNTTYQSAVASTGPSTPLFIDPVGFRVQGTPNWVYSNVLPRRTFNAITNSSSQIPAILRLSSMMDDITFTSNGLTGTSGSNSLGTTVVQRGGRYNAAFLLQRPRNNVRQEVNLKIVVYQNRSVDVAAGEIALGTTSVQAGAGQDLVTVNAPGGTSLRKGSWILLTNAATSSAEAFADFYRVVGFTQSGTTFNFSVSPNIRDHAGGAVYSANVMYLDGVVEVFDRGTMTPFAVPGR